jgi:hypothetical protein
MLIALKGVYAHQYSFFANLRNTQIPTRIYEISRVGPHAWQSPLPFFRGGINKDKFCSVLRATTTDVIAVGFRIPVAMSVYEGKPTLIIGVVVLRVRFLFFISGTSHAH